MPYGEAPWRFSGRAVYQLHLVRAEDARAAVPERLRLVEAFGWCLGACVRACGRAGGRLGVRAGQCFCLRACLQSAHARLHPCLRLRALLPASAACVGCLL